MLRFLHAPADLGEFDLRAGLPGLMDLRADLRAVLPGLRADLPGLMDLRADLRLAGLAFLDFRQYPFFLSLFATHFMLRFLHAPRDTGRDADLEGIYYRKRFYFIFISHLKKSIRLHDRLKKIV
jgi:hypothetical protein